MGYRIRRTLSTRSLFLRRARSASTKLLLMLNSLPASYSSVESCRRCIYQTNPHRSVRKQEARLRFSAGSSRDGTSSLCRTCGSSRPGERATGLRAFIRLPDSSSWSRAQGLKSSSTIRAFLKVRRRAWLRDGRLTIGSRSLRSWHKTCERLGQREPRRFMAAAASVPADLRADRR